MRDIGLLWMRGSLSFLEQLCIKSFVDAGHRTILYSYEPLSGVPDGVETRDAADILPEAGFLVHERTGSPALHSDLFRYKMLERESNMIWADTDAYCLKPFETQTGHYFGWESDVKINGGVLGLPSDSPALHALLEFTKDEFAIPPWFGAKYERELKQARDAGNPVHVSDQLWGTWGPNAVDYFLKQTGEHEYAFPREVLYPFTFKHRRKIVKSAVKWDQFLTDKTASVHLYGRRMRPYIAQIFEGVPDPDGLLGRLLIRHKINPIDAPLAAFPNPDPDHPNAKVFRYAIANKIYPSLVRSAAPRIAD